MPTYGKQKKGFLLSSAVIQDDKANAELNRYPSTYARLGNVKTAFSRTRSRVRLDAETGDNDDEATGQSSAANNHPTRAIRQVSSRSTRANTKHSDGPLAPMPHKLSSQEDLTQTRSEVRNSATHMQASKKSRTLTSDMSLLFANENTFDLNEPVSRPGTSSTTAWSIHGPQNTLPDPGEIQKKITDLMQQAAVQEEDTKRKSELYEVFPSKMSPFNWGKKAFVKATHAIKDRLSIHSTTTPLNRRLDSLSRAHLDQSSETSSVYDSDEDDTKKKLIRRIAEGRNLAKPKIQTMVGDGNVPRKPLPVYESMKSRSLRSGSEEDPFSDDFEAQASAHSQTGGKLNIDFDKRAHENTKVKEEDPVSCHAEKTLGTPQQQQQLSKAKSTPRFSNAISGLAQHPNVMDFSSSPLGFSTPRVRLEPQSSRNGLKTTTGALNRSPSLIEFSFEGRSDDEKSMAPSINSRSVTDGSQSVKRKSAQSDLRSPNFPVSKKPKPVFVSSNEETSLAKGFSKIDTEEEKLPLSPKDHNAMLKPTGHPGSKGRGLTIFELGRGKGLDEGKKARPRPIIGRRSSLPRPSSMLTSGRDSRPGMKRLTSIDADIMDIDELQTDDSRYQVGRKQK